MRVQEGNPYQGQLQVGTIMPHYLSLAPLILASMPALLQLEEGIKREGTDGLAVSLQT